MAIGNDNILIPVDFIKRIGELNGLNSEVYLAIEKNIQREVIIKKIEKVYLNHKDYLEAIYLKEAKHPNVVDISYAGDSSCGKYVYLVMPYYKNGSLKEVIKDKDLSVKEIITYALGFLNGLHSVHIKKLLHLDIKPDNILLSDRKEALLSDFGLVTSFPKGQSIVPNPMFKFLWPPEYFKYGKANIATDIYQVGITLYLLCNKIYFEDLLTPNINENIFKNLVTQGLFYPNKYPLHVSTEFQKIINKCLHKDMSKRYSSVSGILHDLADLEETSLMLWEYNKNNNCEYWTQNNRTCKLDNNGNIEICINKKIDYIGKDMYYLMDFLKK